MLALHRLCSPRVTARTRIRCWMLASLLVATSIIVVPLAAAQEVLPGTEPLTDEGDLAARMVDQVDAFLLQQTELAAQRRAAFWHRDVSSHEAYERSVAENRALFARIIGAVDPRIPFERPEITHGVGEPAECATCDRYVVCRVRWPVLSGVDGEGLLLTPRAQPPIADVIAIGDANNVPELLAGLTGGVVAEADAPCALRLAESGCRVLVPVLIDRSDEYSIVGESRKTNQPHREFVYRGAYEMGRHIIGYEVQKVLAAVDWFDRESRGGRPVGVIGYCEGGLIALCAAALDTRIDVTVVSGYFAPRQALWREPIYRNIWAYLHEFADAELASLVAPRGLIIEASKVPEITGPPPVREGRSGAAPGELSTPSFSSVEEEWQRAKKLVAGLEPPPNWRLIVSGQGNGPPGSAPALQAMLEALVPGANLAEFDDTPSVAVQPVDQAARQKRQFDQLVEYNQRLMREAEYTRRRFWERADASSIEAWKSSTRFYRDYFYDEVIGRFDIPLLPPRPRTRKVYDTPQFNGYEVMLDVWPDVFAYGILLVPKDLKEGERRPVVACQHGLEGRPQDVADPEKENPAYHQYACRLAERGFVTYAPQNLYIGQDRFRTLQRKANPIKKSLFSIIVPQHQVATDWLASLPFVDPQRIAFYGLSYGGKTAMRVPPLVDRYCLSICSADFNEWIWKNVSSRSHYSYLGTGEYEMFEFDLGNTFNYAELAALIAPRPFMVERGHHDGVAPDEWVAYEYAKVRRLYAQLKIPEATTIEFFDGPHTINGVGTFEFLHQHLNWPAGGGL